MKFTFDDFHLIPYVRMTQRGQWVKAAALKYKANQEQLGWLYRAAMQEQGWSMLPPHQPLYVAWKVARRGDLYKCDFDNLLKALVDAAKGIVFVDDRYITRDLGGEKISAAAEFVIAEFGLVADS